MSTQIKPSVTNPTIADVYQSVEAGRLVLKPDFQRKFVWTHDHQEAFLDTILHGFPFPEIYVCQGDVDLAALKTTQFVIDGQQRLTTIKRYIDGIHDKPLTKVPLFADLDEDGRRAFLTYQMVMRDIGKVDDDLIKEIFRRINLTKFNLDDIEIHNAVYSGKFIQTAKYILEHIDLSKYGVFHDSEFTRMADLHFLLLVMSTLENGGYFPHDNEVENYISSFNDEYENADSMKSALIQTFSIIDSFKLPLDSIWFRKSNFFTLVVEITKQAPIVDDDTRQRLFEFESKVISEKGSKSNYGIYYNYMFQNTNGRKARVVRGTSFEDEIIKT